MANEEVETTIDEDMAETLREIQGRTDEPLVEEVDAEEVVDEVEDEITDAEEVESEVDTSKQTDPKPDEIVAADDAPVIPVTGDIDRSLANAPSSWRAGAKAKWASLDPEIRSEIAKREHDMHQGVQKLKETADFGERINRTLQPYEALIRAENGTPETVVQNMLNSAHVLRQGTIRDKLNMTVQLAQQYGYFDELKTALINGAPPPQEQKPGLTESDIDRRVEARFAAQQQSISQQALEQEVQAFIAETNEKGELKYPYVNNVWQEMAALIETEEARGKNMSFEEAYNNALWANPDTRPLIQGQQSQGGGNGKNHVANAIKANANNIDKKPAHVSTKPKPTGSVDDTLRETMADIKSRSA